MISYLKNQFHEYLRNVEEKGLRATSVYELDYELEINSTSAIFINHNSDLFDQEFTLFLGQIYQPLKNLIEKEITPKRVRSKWTFIQALFYSGSWAGDWE